MFNRNYLLKNIEVGNYVILKNNHEHKVLGVGHSVNGNYLLNIEGKHNQWGEYTPHGIKVNVSHDQFNITSVSSTSHTVQVHPELGQSLIKFRIPVKRFTTDSEYAPYRAVIERTFGIKSTELPRRVARYGECIEIICTAEQFTRFVIARVKCGLISRCKELEPEIIQSFQHGMLTFYVAENQ